MLKLYKNCLFGTENFGLNYKSKFITHLFIKHSLSLLKSVGSDHYESLGAESTFYDFSRCLINFDRNN